MTFAVGELLLGGFGVDHGRFISSMSIMLVLVLVLTFFLNLAAGRRRLDPVPGARRGRVHGVVPGGAVRRRPAQSALMGGEVLWRPSGARTRLDEFTDAVRDGGGPGFDSYEELWRWSVDDLDAFWSAVWGFFDVPVRRRSVDGPG